MRISMGTKMPPPPTPPTLEWLPLFWLDIEIEY